MLTLGRGTLGSRIVPELLSSLDRGEKERVGYIRTNAYLAGDRSSSGRFAIRPIAWSDLGTGEWREKRQEARHR